MSNSPFDHFATTQVHFSGVTDAIDRTRAVGAVGWSGERYSYFNSLKVVDNSNNRLASGLGASLPSLRFNPVSFPHLTLPTFYSLLISVLAV